MPVGEQLLGGLGIETVRAIEAAIGLGIERAGIEMHGQADEVLGLAHQERQTEALAQPAGEPDMIGMVVCHQDAGERAAAQQGADDPVPGRAGRRVVKPGIEHRPTALVLDQIDVDVVEPVGEREPQPQQAGRHLDRRAGRRRGLMRKGQGGCEGGLEHAVPLPA